MSIIGTIILCWISFLGGVIVMAIFYVSKEKDYKEFHLCLGFRRRLGDKQVNVSILTLDEKAYFAILYAQSVSVNQNFLDWAKNWINGTDRSRAAANTAANIARLEAKLETDTRTMAAVNAANAAINAAEGRY